MMNISLIPSSCHQHGGDPSVETHEGRIKRQTLGNVTMSTMAFFAPGTSQERGVSPADEVTIRAGATHRDVCTAAVSRLRGVA